MLVGDFRIGDGDRMIGVFILWGGMLLLGVWNYFEGWWRGYCSGWVCKVEIW